ncbi:MAG TPA: ABC transporter permease [Candidatus Limnocylindria bacterium]|nr:ABC transporter permease [Candidatus Limnocylindria bacterium]
MLKYTIRRLLLLIPTMFFVAVIVFFLAHAAPGSPFDAKAVGDKQLPLATILRLERLYGVDKPVHEQFILYLENLARFDFGNSFRSGRPVSDIIGDGFPVSAQLGIQALLVAIAFALPLGVVSALKQNSAVDYGSLFFATVGTTIPSFVLGIFAIYIFGVAFHMFPFVGWSTPAHWVLPTVILALGPMAFLTRITRASMLEAIRQDYVRTARAKGLREQVVIVAHVMKNAMIPVATIVGPATAGLITGSIIIEGLFSIPGIGRLFLQSILGRDYPLIMAVYLLYALLISLANLSVDLVYGVLDPRIKVAK